MVISQYIARAYHKACCIFHVKYHLCLACVGALIWHGRDLRRYRRLLSPPLQRLLTCPGTAALGRGVAVMPASSSVSPASALAHLASDAVRAAAESPFLEGSLADASAVLCCIALPTPPGPALKPPCLRWAADIRLTK